VILEVLVAGLADSVWVLQKQMAASKTPA